MTYARIIGTGSYVPEKILTNDDLSRMLGENINEFVSQVIGINERHICAADESTADLAVAAARARRPGGRRSARAAVNQRARLGGQRATGALSQQQPVGTALVLAAYPVLA